MCARLPRLRPARQRTAPAGAAGGTVVFARDGALLRGQLGPVLHLRLQALLLFRFHLGIALGRQQPFLAPAFVKIVPVARQRGQNLLLLSRELGPIGLLLFSRGGEGEGGEKGDAQPERQGCERFSHVSKLLSR